MNAAATIDVADLRLAVLGVASHAIAISAVGAGSASYAIGSAVSALAMGLVILGKVVRLREQRKTAK